MLSPKRPLRLEVLEDRTVLSASPELLADINPGEDSDPSGFVTIGDTTFFIADDGTHGRELWKSDGTEAGTVMVKDIMPGDQGSIWSRSSLANVNGTLFFTAYDATHGEELWKSDGTEAGTVMVKNINQLSLGSSPHSLTNVSGTLFFFATDTSQSKNPTDGLELWKSDGTEAGTVMVKDIMPGDEGSISWPGSLANVNGTLFFSADDGTHSHELWKSDGTEAGTVMVRDINPGGDSNPSGFVTIGDTTFFRAYEGTNGSELWRSDGTQAGTFMVRDIMPGIGDSYPGSLTNVNGTLFFTADDGSNGRELWKSDGTAAGTLMVKDVNVGLNDADAYSLTNVNGTLFFGAADGSHGEELWRSDGTEAGTVMVRDIMPGIGDSIPYYLTNVNGTLFFSAGELTNGLELWRSDGTEAGTVMVKDIYPGFQADTRPRSLANVNGTLFFNADDGTHGTELWKLGPVLFGTSGDDTITVEMTGSYQVTINGQTYVYPNDELTIVAGGGTDTVSVVGTADDQTLVASPDSFELTGAGFSLTGEEIDHLTVRGNGGNDVATLMDSPGNERVVAKVNNTFVRDLAGTFTQRVIDFGEVTLISTGSAAGNFDLANLFDSVADDVFVGHAETASMTSPGYIVRTSGYDRNVARSKLGGQDVAILHGTAEGNENFTARVTANPANNFGLLRSGPGAPLPFLNRAIGFSSVSGNSHGGNDKAYFFDGSGNDLLFATSTFARLLGTGYEFRANDFQRVNSKANAGGNDQAILVDGTGDDRLVGTKNRATLYGDSNSFIHSTIGFERVTGDASEGGTDRLVLAGDITFTFFELGAWEL